MLGWVVKLWLHTDGVRACTKSQRVHYGIPHSRMLGQGITLQWGTAHGPTWLPGSMPPSVSMCAMPGALSSSRSLLMTTIPSNCALQDPYKWSLWLAPCNWHMCCGCIIKVQVQLLAWGHPMLNTRLPWRAHAACMDAACRHGRYTVLVPPSTLTPFMPDTIAAAHLHTLAGNSMSILYSTSAD